MKKVFSICGSILLAFWSVLLLPLAPVAQAAPGICTWDGSSSANWSDPLNWDLVVGCDGAGIPEAGDDLVFPAGASNLSMNNDLGVLIYPTVTVSGNGYTFAGSDINISNSWQFIGTGNTVTSNINYTNAGSSSMTIASGSTGNVINGNIVLALTAGGDMNTDVNEDINHNGAITGSTDTFQQIGTNTWITSATNVSTFTSTSVNIATGYFQCRNDNCFGADANPVGNSSGGSLQFNDASLLIDNNISLSSSTSPQLNQMPGQTSLNGTLTVNSTASLYVQGGGTFVAGGTTTLNANANILGSTYSTSLFEFLGTVVDGTGGDINVNTAELILIGNNTYTGITTVNSGSLVAVVHVNGLGATSGNTVVNTGGSLLFGVLADQTIAAEPITINGNGIDATYNGAIVNQTNIRTLPGVITLGSNSTLSSQANGSLVSSGSVVGTGDLAVKTSGLTAEISFTGGTPNTYVGTTTSTNSNLGLYKTAGVVSIPGDFNITSSGGSNSQTLNNGGGQIADSSKVVFTETGAGNSSMQVAGTDTVGSIAGNGDIVIIAPQTFFVGNDNTSTTYSGIIYGGGTLEKIGTGTLTLDGTNPGPVAPFIVSGGTLTVMTDFSGSSFAVNSGATLKGTGQTGATLINTAGTFAAGTSPGCMTVASLTLTAGSNFNEELASDIACTGYDQTTVTGAADLGNATLNVLPSYTPAAGTIFTIIQAGSVTGTFNGLANGATFTASGINFRINYSGTQVTLTVLGGTLAPTGQSTSWINTLATLLLISSGAGLMLVTWRTRKNNLSKN